jgi:hypothetical protein
MKKTIALIAALSLSACGGGGAGSTTNLSPILTPSTSPPASPTPVVSIPSSSTAFGFYAPGQTQSFSVAQSGYVGPFSASSNNASVATVTPESANSFVITTGSTAGFATITVTGGSGLTATVQVTLSIVTGTIE